MLRRPTHALLLAALVALPLTACAPSAETQDKKACQDWSDVITDWTNAGGGELAAQGAAGKLSSRVIPEASPSLATDMKVIAKAIDAYEQTSSSTEIAASNRLGARCKAVGAPLSTS